MQSPLFLFITYNSELLYSVIGEEPEGIFSYPLSADKYGNCRRA